MCEREQYFGVIVTHARIGLHATSVLSVRGVAPTLHLRESHAWLQRGSHVWLQRGEPRLIAAGEPLLRAAAEAPLRVLLLQLLVACQPAQEFSSSDGTVSIVAGAHQQALIHPAKRFISRRCERVAAQGALTRWRERLCPFHKHSLTAAPHLGKVE